VRSQAWAAHLSHGCPSKNMSEKMNYTIHARSERPALCYPVRLTDYMQRWGSHDTAYDSSVSKFTSPIVLANAENLASGGKWADNANVDPACLGKRKTFVSGEATELSGSGIFYDAKRQAFFSQADVLGYVDVAC
jgi:hypothetical protein